MINNGNLYGTFEKSQNNKSTTTKIKLGRALIACGSVLLMLSPIANVSINQSKNFDAQQTTVIRQQQQQQSSRISSLEKLFLSIPEKNHARNHLLQYSSTPHSAGTTADYATAMYTLSKFRQYGLNATIQTYDVLLSKPIRRKVSILSPTPLDLSLHEDSVPNDSCTSSTDALPPFIAYSPSGNVTGNVVYANYGTQDDFKTLMAATTTSLAGKIALVRYGKNYRGLKAMLAQSYGMAGVLVYSDPANDGFGRGPTYPSGPWRPPSSVQRGSGQFI